MANYRRTNYSGRSSLRIPLAGVRAFPPSLRPRERASGPGSAARARGTRKRCATRVQMHGRTKSTHRAPHTRAPSPTQARARPLTDATHARSHLLWIGRNAEPKQSSGGKNTQRVCNNLTRAMHGNHFFRVFSAAHSRRITRSYCTDRFFPRAPVLSVCFCAAASQEREKRQETADKENERQKAILSRGIVNNVRLPFDALTFVTETLTELF